MGVLVAVKEEVNLVDFWVAVEGVKWVEVMEHLSLLYKFVLNNDDFE